MCEVRRLRTVAAAEWRSLRGRRGEQAARKSAREIGAACRRPRSTAAGPQAPCTSTCSSSCRRSCGGQRSRPTACGSGRCCPSSACDQPVPHRPLRQSPSPARTALQERLRSQIAGRRSRCLYALPGDGPQSRQTSRRVPTNVIRPPVASSIIRSYCLASCSWILRAAAEVAALARLRSACCRWKR